MNNFLTKILAIALHAVIRDGYATPAGVQSQESFIGAFPEDRFAYVEHMEAAVRLAAQLPDTMVIPTGGMTHQEAGMRSEGATHCDLAEGFGYWGHQEVKQRTVPEEFALTSLENILYVIALFKLKNGRWPEHLTMLGWKFKEERFWLHAQAIQWPSNRFSYVGVNNPEGKALKDAILSEARLVARVKDDPLMVGPEFATKRALRNPFGRKHPYRGLDHALDDLFDFLERHAFLSALPWASE